MLEQESKHGGCFDCGCQPLSTPFSCNDREVSFDERILGDELRLNLGLVCVRLTDLDAAEAHFKAVSTHGLHAEAAQRNLSVVLEIRRQLG